MARAMKDSGIEWIGEIPDGWETIRLKHCCSIMSGYPFDSAKFSNSSGYPLIRIRDITSGKVETFFDGDYDPSYIVSDEDVLVGMDGDFNVRWWNAGNALLNQRCCKVTTKTGLSSRYLYYCLPLLLDRINQLTYSTTVKHLSVDDIYGAAVPFIPEHEQTRISAFLDAECARIDAVIEQTRASIEEYKKLKQAVITEAVTKGIRPGRRMVNSGVDWLGQIPDEWAVFRIANLYDERNERGTDDLPILTVSINTGISDHEIPDEEKDRVVARSEDRTLYKRVCPGDLAYNMMRAWQGAFGAARVDGMVSPSYVVAKPKMPGILDSRYVEALLRTPSAIEEMHRYSRGITDFRLRLYWPEFKNICVCVPSVKEQIEIADYIDAKAAEIDTLIQKKQQFLDEMESYKKSLIFEYVTGKKCCSERTC